MIQLAKAYRSKIRMELYPSEYSPSYGSYGDSAPAVELKDKEIAGLGRPRHRAASVASDG